MQALDIMEPSSKLAGCEVTIDQRVVFKLDLPNRKIISVKSKSAKLIIDVLRPILHKYKFSLDEVHVTKAGYPVDTGLAVTTIDNARLNVQLKGRFQFCEPIFPLKIKENCLIDTVVVSEVCLSIFAESYFPGKKENLNKLNIQENVAETKN